MNSDSVDRDAANRDSVDRIVAAWAERDPDLDASPLEVVGRLLLAASYAERAIVAALAPFGLSFPDFDVINTLRRRADPAGTNPRDLARSSLVTSGAMTARVDRLARAGLVDRVPDPKDRRGVLVRLTARGETLAEQAVVAVLAADRAILEPLDQRQRAATAAALKKLLLRWEADG